MKKLLLSSFAAAFFLQANAQSYIPIAVSGFNADVIANGSVTAITSTTADVDGEGYNLVAPTYVSPVNLTPTSYLPATGLINSAVTPDLMFQLAAYTGNNSLRLTNTTGPGTLTFTTPRTADQICLLVTSGNSATFTATVNYTDATTEAFAGNLVSHWYFGAGSIAIQGTSRVRRANDYLENSSTEPRLFQVLLTPNAANAGKLIQSITFTKTSPAAKEVLNVFAVTAKVLLPHDAAVTALNSPTSPVTQGVSQPVNVTIKNAGSATLASATLGFSVNGTVVANNVPFTGSVASGQSTATPFTIGNYTFPNGNHTVKAWVKSPNGQTDGNSGNDTARVTIAACNALAGTFTINRTAPASATNFQTIAAAGQALGCGVNGPVTFNVVPNTGPYPEQVILRQISGASATNLVTFNGNGNTVYSTPVGQDFGIVTLDGTDYVKLDNFVLQLPGSAATGWGIQLKNGADHNILSNNTINLPLNSSSPDQNGIVAGTNATVAGNNTNYTVIRNNTVNGGYTGIRINGNAGGTDAAGNQVTGNFINDFFTQGLVLTNTTGTLVEGNDISRPLRSAVAFFTVISLTGTNASVQVSKNRIHNPFGAVNNPAIIAYGISSSDSDAPAGSENVVKNNLIYDMNTSNMVYGINNTGSDGTWYYHNTIVLDHAANNSACRGFYQSGTAVNIKFINNLVSMGPGLSGAKHAVYFGTPGVGIMSNNNVLHTTGGAFAGYLGGDFLTIAQWKTANSSAYDQNSVAANPVFSNAAIGNLLPTGSGVNNAGQALPAVPTDITGAPRSVTTPDPGAYEFTVNPNDVGVTAVAGPVNTGCGFSNAETITVTIKNFGAAAQTSVPIILTVNGSQIASETYSGNLAPNATDTYVFNTKASLGAAGTYTLVAKTNLSGDASVSNNADTLRVTNYLVTGMPKHFDFETATTGLTNFRTVKNANSDIREAAAASSPLTAGSAKGLILEGVDNPNWLTPAGITAPWTSNPDNFAGVYICISPAGGLATDSLWLTFDLKQLFKSSNANTNFRVTVNGTQVGPTYRPPFSGTPIAWQKFKIDLTQYRSAPTVQIGLESSVKEAFANGTGTANLIDNINFQRRLVSGPNGTRENALAAQLHVFPNPGNGNFFVSLENGREYDLKVTDLSGKVIALQKAKGDTKLNLEGIAKGIYLLKVSSENGTAVRKLIVE